MTEFDEHSKRALLAGEKAGCVCSFCGAVLPANYYMLLEGWRSEDKELVSPTMRFCLKCWERIEKTVYSAEKQLVLV